MPVIELRVLNGSQGGSTIPLKEGKFLIGREHDCQLRPNSELVSRHHCAFTVDSFSVRLRDLGSTNGTFVNGERIRSTTVLKPGDRVLVGKLDLQVVIDGQPAAIPEETLHAQKDETIVTGRKPAATPAPVPEGDSGFDFSTLSEAVSQLEDETSVKAPLPAPAATVVGTMMVEPAPAPELAPAVATLPDPNAVVPAVPPGYPPQYAPNPWMQAPQYPYPPAYPQYPGMPPYGYAYPYPGMPMPQMPMQPLPPGYAHPAAPPQAAPVEEAPAEEAAKFPDFRLPDPATTGAKAPPPPAPPKPEEAGKPKAHIPSAAQDIINSYLNRRPNTKS